MGNGLICWLEVVDVCELMVNGGGLVCFRFCVVVDFVMVDLCFLVDYVVFDCIVDVVV